MYTSVFHILERFRIYIENIKMIKIWQMIEQGTAVYGETRFMDLTPEEFQKVFPLIKI